MNDFAVIDYAATLDGRPLLEVEPKAPKMLGGRCRLLDQAGRKHVPERFQRSVGWHANR